MLADSRVACAQLILQDALWAEFDFLDSIPLRIWKFIASSVATSPEELRDQVVAAASISWSFLEWRALLVAGSYLDRLFG